jgi:hypothetical protein
MAHRGKRRTGDAWGDDISKERKAELEARLQAWGSEADHGSEKDYLMQLVTAPWTR